MKNGKFAKILVLALSLALLIGSAVGIAASASTDSTGEIYAQSIVHDDKIQIAFAVDATADEVLAGTVALEYYFDGATASTKTAALYVDANGDAVLKDGKVVLVTEGISAQDLTSVVTATTKVNGEVKATKTYSVVQFLLTKLYRDGFATTSDAEDAKYADLYLSLIDYSAKAQAVFDPEETSINDWFYVDFDNATYNGESFLVSGEALTLDFANATAATVTNYSFKDKWNVTVDGTMAPYATDATLDVSTNTAIAPVMEIASGTGKYFNDANFTGVKYDFEKAYNETDTLLTDDVTGAQSKALEATVQDDGTGNKVLTGDFTGWNGLTIWSKDDNRYSSGTYVFEADFSFQSAGYHATKGVFFAGFNSADTTSTTNYTNTSCFEFSQNYTDKASGDYYQFFDPQYLNNGVRYNLRIENNIETNITKVYVNGEYVGEGNYGTSEVIDYATANGNTNTKMDAFVFYLRAASTMTLDNICLGVVDGVVAE